MYGAWKSESGNCLTVARELLSDDGGERISVPVGVMDAWRRRQSYDFVFVLEMGTWLFKKRVWGRKR